MKLDHWRKYQRKIEKWSLKMTAYNKINDFNILETEPYNHVRDIFCLSLTKIKPKNKKINILDYGSNILTLSNLENKIKLNKMHFTIYDPYYKKNSFSHNHIRNVKFMITNNINNIVKKKYDFVNLGSSIQYEPNILNKINKLKLEAAKFVLISHTPLSLSQSYSSPQNYVNTIQFIHSYDSVIKFFKKKKFSLIFKSRMNDKFIACKYKKKPTHYLNLLFSNEKNYS